jgi:regulator of protease activity HflC (stomatin/prohibitin superfamily)
LTRLIFILFIAVFLAVIAAKTFVRVKQGEVAVVFRLGQLFQVHGPGRQMVFPFFDRVVRVNLQSIVGWETMSEDQLKDAIIKRATTP